MKPADIAQRYNQIKGNRAKIGKGIVMLKRSL
jgi:hypothetical protein